MVYPILSDFDIRLSKSKSQKNLSRTNSDLDINLFCEKAVIYEMFDPHFASLGWIR